MLSLYRGCAQLDAILLDYRREELESVPSQRKVPGTGILRLYGVHAVRRLRLDRTSRLFVVLVLRLLGGDCGDDRREDSIRLLSTRKIVPPWTESSGNKSGNKGIKRGRGGKGVRGGKGSERFSEIVPTSFDFPNRQLNRSAPFFTPTLIVSERDVLDCRVLDGFFVVISYSLRLLSPSFPWTI